MVTKNRCGRNHTGYRFLLVTAVTAAAMIAAGMATVAQVANENKIPTIVGEGGMVLSGGLATYGINYYELGKLTAEMAVQILKGEKKPAEMPVQYLKKFDLNVNEETAKALGITIPENL